MKCILQPYFKNVQTINNFIRAETTKEAEKREYFLYAGVLEKHKGVLNLVKAFSHTDKRILLAGTGSEYENIKKIKTNNVELLGWTDHAQLLCLMNKAKALILPSLWLENNPLVALEAFSVGTPAIGSNTGGIPEIIAAVDPALIFEKDDVVQLTNIINNFDSKKYDRNRIKEIYEKNFSQQIFMKKYLDVIKDAQTL